MKILISDYEDVLKRDLDYEKELLLKALPQAMIEVYAYTEEESFIEKMRDVNVLSTAFLPITKKVLREAVQLQCISVNATGYGNIDVEEAARRNIEICTVKEYCTQEVAEHTMALLLALTRNLKHYSSEIDKHQIWQYQSVPDMKRLAGQTMVIFGCGRIGQAVAKRARAFDLNILVVDPYFTQEQADDLGVTLVDKSNALKGADIISNHMNQNESNINYFSKDEFQSMQKTPVFINVGRGACVDEQALINALDGGWIRAAGLDVLKEENPDLTLHPLVGRNNVILTPHAAFYSEQSMRDLQRVTCENIIRYYLLRDQ